MELKQGCLYLEDYDCDHIQGDIDDGLSIAEAVENQVIVLGGWEFKDIHEIVVNPKYTTLGYEIAKAFKEVVSK